MDTHTSVTAFSSPSRRLQKVQEEARKEADMELDILLRRIIEVAADASDLSTIDLYSRAKRESLFRIASTLNFELGKFQSPVTYPTVAAE